MIKACQFFAIIVSALALVPAVAHVAALLNKIGMAQADYFTAQSIYTGWAALGLLWPAAVVLNGLVAFLAREQRLSFWLAVTSALLFVVSLIVFAIWTLPANQQTNNWTTVPADWEVLRRRWEYSHAANSVLLLIALSLSTASALSWRARAQEKSHGSKVKAEAAAARA